MADREVLILKFAEISGRDEYVARFYLSNNNWILENALSRFFMYQREYDIRTTFSPKMTIGKPFAKLGAVRTIDSVDYLLAKKAIAATKFATIIDVNTNNNVNITRRKRLADYDGDDNDISTQTELGPPKTKYRKIQISVMFELFKRNFANKNNIECSSNHISSAYNCGQGTWLNATAVSSLKGSNDAKKSVCVVKLWRQGFTVDDNELHSYDEPYNKEFLQAILCRTMPLKIPWKINIIVQDHRNEDYQMDTSIRNTFIASDNTFAVSTTFANTFAENENHSKDILDPSQPYTTIKMLLTDGSHLTAQFNLSHTVADIENFIKTVRPQYTLTDFILLSTFPTREFNDTSLTIEAIGVRNAVLLQRLK